MTISIKPKTQQQEQQKQQKATATTSLLRRFMGAALARFMPQADEQQRSKRHLAWDNYASVSCLSSAAKIGFDLTRQACGGCLSEHAETFATHATCARSGG